MAAGDAHGQEEGPFNPNADADEFADEEADYGYQSEPEEDDTGDEKEQGEETISDDDENDELGAEDGEECDVDDLYGAEGFAPL